MKKILITGGSGLLGQYLNITLSEEHYILTLYNSTQRNTVNFNSESADITDYTLINRIFTEFNPDIVIHTAGITRPEISDEMEYKEVVKINTESVKHIAERCDLNKSKLIFTSTDLIYDGDKGGMLREDAQLKPLSNYAASKIEAEEAIKNTYGNYVILRTALLYGIGLEGSQNNFHSMLKNFIDGKTSNLFYDQFRTPLSLVNAAEMIKSLSESDVREITINFAGKEKLSRVELGDLLCEIGGFNRELINAVSMYENKTIKPVADVSLSTELLRDLGLKQNSVENEIKNILNIDL